MKAKLSMLFDYGSNARPWEFSVKLIRITSDFIDPPYYIIECMLTTNKLHKLRSDRHISFMEKIVLMREVLSRDIYNKEDALVVAVNIMDSLRPLHDLDRTSDASHICEVLNYIIISSRLPDKIVEELSGLRVRYFDQAIKEGRDQDVE